MLIVTVPIISLALFVYVEISGHMRDMFNQENRQAVLNITIRIEEALKADIRNGELLAARLSLKAAVIRRDREEITRDLKDFVDHVAPIERAFVADKEGVILANYSEDLLLIGKSFADRDWYKGVSKKWGPYVSEFYLRAGRPQKHLFAIALPIRDADNNVIGVLVLQAFENYIQEAISHIPAPENQKVYVVDKKGHLICHPDYHVDRIIDFTEFPSVKNVINGESGIKTLKNPDGTSMLTAYQPVKQWGWGVIVQRPEQEVYASLSHLSYALFTFTGIMIMIGALLGYRRSEALFSLKKLSGELEARVEERTTELRHAKKEWEETFDSINDPIMVLDTQYHIIRANKAMAAKLGIPVQKVPGLTCYEHIHGKSGPSPLCPHKKLLSDGQVHTSEIYEERLGGYYIISVSPHYDQEGNLIGSIHIAYDITERKKAEAKLKEYSEHLEDMVRTRTKELEDANVELQLINKELDLRKVEADAANKAKSDFLANMSHELRTPLNSVIGFAEVLEDGLYGSLNEKQQTYVGDILGSGRHLLQLINDILDLSKVEAGKLELNPCEFSLSDVLEGSLTMFKEKAMKHGIKLNTKLEADTDIRIEADERKLKQIMFNLLGNAMKFTPDGGYVGVSAKQYVGAAPSGCPDEGEHRGSPLQTPLFQRGESPPLAKGDKGGFYDYIEISVEDTGIGIKSEDLPKLFHEFTQLESAYTKNHDGTGLGLALTKKLVELHAGSIRVESEFGKGSRFVFVIPVKQGTTFT